MKEMQVVLLTYGIPNELGDVVTEQAALQAFDTLKQQLPNAPVRNGLRLVNVAMEGDRTSGNVLGTYQVVQGE